MTDGPPSPPLLTTGTKGSYQWLTTEHDLDTLLSLCPNVAIGKYLAITSRDSGFHSLNDIERSAGWEIHGNIAYSPIIELIETLPSPGGWDEWYVFGSPIDLGCVCEGNAFTAPQMLPGQVWVFVNYDLVLHRSEQESIADLLWRQLEWMNPESYIADGGDRLNFVSRDKDIFRSVHQALRSSIV
jgi:hypothetical protein